MKDIGSTQFFKVETEPETVTAETEVIPPPAEDPPGAKRYKQEKVRVKDVFN